MAKRKRLRMILPLVALTIGGCHHGSVRTKSASSTSPMPATLVERESTPAADAPSIDKVVLEQDTVQLVQHLPQSSRQPTVLLASLPLDRQKNTDPRDDQSPAGSTVDKDLASQDKATDSDSKKDADKDSDKDREKDADKDSDKDAKDDKDKSDDESKSADKDKSKDDKQPKASSERPSIQLAQPPTYGSYNLEQLIALARANNPAIRQAEAAVAKVEGLRHQVGLRPNPMVGYNGTQLADQKTEQHTVYVSQDIVTAQKLERNTNVLGLEVENLKWQAEIQRRAVSGDIKQLFFESLGAQQKLELSKKFVDMAEKSVEVSRLRKKAGEGTEVDVLQSEVQLQQIAVSNRQQAAALTGAWNRMAAVVGQSDMPLAVIDGELPSDPRPYDWDAEYARLCAESPELMAAQARLARARANLDRQRVQATPNISWMVGAGYDRATDSQLINTQVGIPLPINNQNEGNVSAAHADYCRSTQEVRRIQLSLKSRLASASQAYQSSAASVELYKSAVIPKAEKMLELAELTFRAGEIDFLQVLTIRRTYFDSMLEYLNSRTELAQANANIEELLLGGSLDATTDSSYDDGLRGQTLSGQ